MFRSSKAETHLHEDVCLKVLVYYCFVQGAFTGVCSSSHVPSFMNNCDKFKAKGVDSIVCVAVNDPYTMNAWAEKLGAKDKVTSLRFAVGLVSWCGRDSLEL